ncbi:MAG: ImmA/IrrE family metallo-endopeptidase [Rhodocyclales bacterium]|nr:ImmA/IrrE family metallo-endopeptidase [Rhodocyclales bacterium]MBI5784478.1 ImmA/IrrE family metallo-endopeptidase [Rhodocyclales bacterium]
MERINALNPDRIAWCCADHGITSDQLAAECGISPATLQRAMERVNGLTFHQLQTIAHYFGRGVLFFLEDAPVAVEQVHTPQFRTLANKKPELSARLRALIERTEQHRDLYLSLRERLDEEDFPRYRPPDIAGLSPAQASVVARDWLGLGPVNTFETYREAVEAHGILVFRSNGYNGKWQIAKESPILGFSIYDETCPVIVVKKLDWEPRQSFTLMHELGHILLHRVSWIDDDGDFQSHQGAEREANAFAGNLLVPNDLLTTIDDAARPGEVALFDDWLEQQRRAWGVSGEVILRRLMDNGRLQHAEYEAYRRWRQQTAPRADDGGNRAWRHREPVHIFGDRYVRAILDSLGTRSITLTKASTYLDRIKLRDLHQLEGYYAGL